MGTGVLPRNVLIDICSELQNVEGDFAEIGVFEGCTFRELITQAKAQGRRAIAFDSFLGMAKPGEFDEGQSYYAGRFSVGGAEGFRGIQRAFGIPDEAYEVGAGFVPECFGNHEDRRFAFIYLDLDHYSATAIAIGWAWDHLSLGGALVCDDYFSGRPLLASKAIDSFIREHPDVRTMDLENDQIAIWKSAT